MGCQQFQFFTKVWQHFRPSSYTRRENRLHFDILTYHPLGGENPVSGENLVGGGNNSLSESKIQACQKPLPADSSELQAVQIVFETQTAFAIELGVQSTSDYANPGS